jgi:hypothetical protein
MSVLNSGNASTLDVVQGVRNLLPRVEATLPPELKIQPLGDQAQFVRAAVGSVIREVVVAACLTGLIQPVRERGALESGDGDASVLLINAARGLECFEST